MKQLANPLHYPLVVLLGMAILVIGVRILDIPKILMLVIAIAIAFVGASVRKSQRTENPALKREISKLKQQSQSLAEQANKLRQESAKYLTSSTQLELLATIQYVCDRAQELPAKTEAITSKLQGENSLLSSANIERQLREATAKHSKSSGAAQQQLSGLITSLKRNLELAKQGEDTREAQIYALSNQIIDAAGILQQLQNQIITADLNNADNINELANLSEELKSFQENVDILTN